MAQAAWGIDIGRSSLKAVKIQKVKDGLEITDLDRIEYRLSKDGAVSGSQVTEAVAEFLSRHKIKKERVVVALPGHVAFTRFIKLPPVEAKRIEEIIKYEAQQQIPFPIDEVIWGYQVLGKQEGAEELEVGLFAIKRELVYGFVEDLVSSGLEADVLTIAPLAIYNFVTFDQDLPPSAVVLDIGHEHTDLIIVDGDRFWIRNLALAGQDITKALVEKFKLNFRDAEKLKRNAAKSKQAQKIFSVFEPVLRDFVGEIHRSVGFYKSQSRTAKFEDILLLGGATKVIGLKEVFSRELRFRVHRMGKLNKLSVEAGVDTQVLKVHLGSFAVAMGLALQGLGVAGRGETGNTVNLMPREMVQKKEISRKKPMAIACVAVLLVWLLGLMVIKGKVHGALERTSARTQEPEIAGLRKIQQEATAERGKYLKPENECKALVGLIKDRMRILSILDDIHKTIPESVNNVVNPALENEKILESGKRPTPLSETDIDALQRVEDAAKVWILELAIDRIQTPVYASQDEQGQAASGGQAARAGQGARPGQGSRAGQNRPEETGPREVADFKVEYQIRMDAAIKPNFDPAGQVLWAEVQEAFDDRLTSKVRNVFRSDDVHRTMPQDPRLLDLIKDTQSVPRDPTASPNYVPFSVSWKVDS